MSTWAGRRWLGSRGVAALEFALIVPVLVLLSFGVVDFAAAVRVQIDVDQAARAVANLIAQQADVTTAQLNDFYLAGQYCFSGNTGTMSISAASVVFSAGVAAGAVAWDASSVSARYVAAPGNILSLSSGLGASSGGAGVGGDGTIVAQAKSTFAVPVAFGPIPATFTFVSTAFARPRAGFTVKLN